MLVMPVMEDFCVGDNTFQCLTGDYGCGKYSEF